MIIEIGSSIIVGGVVGYTYLKQHGGTSEHAKIERICANSNLVVKEKTGEKTIRLYRKKKLEGGTEYIYKIPLGLSFDQFAEKKNKIEDGLNVKKGWQDFTLKDFKSINWKDYRNIYPQLVEVINNKQDFNKEIEMSYDGMLRIKVWNHKLTNKFDFTDELLDQLKGWEVPIGLSRSGLIKHDFDDFPHILVAGTTKYGKSVWLKTVVTTLLSTNQQNVKLTLIDLKGGLTFGRYKNLKQTKTLASDLEETLESLEEIDKDLDKRLKLFKEKGYENVNEAKFKDRNFIIVDEAAELSSNLATDKEEKRKKARCEQIMSKITRIGGSIGYRLIYATQAPYREVLNPQIKQNCDAKLCFRLPTESVSRVVLDEQGAEELPVKDKNYKGGRAIYKTDMKRVVQAPYIENSYIDEKIKPLIRIQPRKEGVSTNEQEDSKGKEDRQHIIKFEENGLYE